MSRRRKAVKRELIPDPRYRDIIISKFSNSLMQHGRKAISEGILYGALEKINEKTVNRNGKYNGPFFLTFSDRRVKKINS